MFLYQTSTDVTSKLTDSLLNMPDNFNQHRIKVIMLCQDLIKTEMKLIMRALFRTR